MHESTIESVWATAAAFDPALRPTTALLRTLARKRIQAQPATRERLFSAAAQSRPVLLSGVDVPVAGSAERGVQGALLHVLARAFPPRETASAQVGPTRARRRLAIAELMRRWQSSRHIVGITDLHVRGTRLERDIDTDALSSFNLLPVGSEDMRRQEMMTMVVSSRGNVTDSHSDDPDGSNHCFVGRKLWLAWETFEGRSAGLQDCSRDRVDDSARFKLGAFCALKSASWWTVGPGETLFLPGALSHRVVTLEPYMGIGSFYCTPASCLENLSRWYQHGALWSLDDHDGENAGLIDEIAVAMRRKLQRLARQGARSQQQWGVDFAGLALQRWQRRWTPASRARLMAQHRPFAGVVAAMEALAQPETVRLAA